MSRTVAIAQARLGSTRLPGKVMMSLAGRPVIEWVVRALRAAPGVDQVVIATSTLPQDDLIADWCDNNGVDVFRGSEADVLARFVGAAEEFGGDVFLRLTCDCPFLDPRVVGDVIRLRQATGAAYASNISPATWPDGLDTEVFTREALFAAHSEAVNSSDRDCVTQFIERNRTRFPAQTMVCPIPGLHKERWVLDTASDFDFCKAVALHFADWTFDQPPSYLDILNLLDEHPEYRALNANHIRNERFYEGLAAEKRAPYSFGGSQKALERALKTVPLGSQTFSKSHVQYPAGQAPLFMSHGDGGYAFDIDGNRFVDLVSGLLPNVLGYRDPDVDRAVHSQLASGVSFSLATDLEARLAETLVRLIPCAEQVRYGKNGADVTAASIRVARAATGREEIMLVQSGYHGWHDWSIATTERNLGVPKRESALSVRSSGDLDKIERCFAKGKFAAVIIEPEGRSKAYLSNLKTIAEKHGVILIFDEVITGFRWNLGGYQKHIGVTPHVATFGKAMANGHPLSAIVGPRELMKFFEPPNNVFYSGTFFGEAVSLAASIATIDKMEREEVIQSLWLSGASIREQAQNVIESHDLVEVIRLYGESPRAHVGFTGRGNLSADILKALWMKEMIAAGTLVIATHNVCYAHKGPEITQVVNAYDRACEAIVKAIDKGSADVSAAAGKGVR